MTVVIIIIMWIMIILAIAGPPGLMIRLLKVRAKPKAFDYNNRWDDLNYVKMMHETRELEKANGLELTPCACTVHSPFFADTSARRNPGVGATTAITEYNCTDCGAFFIRNDRLYHGRHDVYCDKCVRRRDWSGPRYIAGDYNSDHKPEYAPMNQQKTACMACGDTIHYYRHRPTFCFKCQDTVNKIKRAERPVDGPIKMETRW